MGHACVGAGVGLSRDQGYACISALRGWLLAASLRPTLGGDLVALVPRSRMIWNAEENCSWWYVMVFEGYRAGWQARSDRA